VNHAGFYHIIRLVIAEMEKRACGHVATATASIGPTAISGIYSVLAAMTKGGLNAATKSLSDECAKKGIRVHAVAPGIVKTPMRAPENHGALGAFHPIGRMGETRYRRRHPVSRVGAFHHRRDFARRRWYKCWSLSATQTKAISALTPGPSIVRRFHVRRIACLDRRTRLSCAWRALK